MSQALTIVPTRRSERVASASFTKQANAAGPLRSRQAARHPLPRQLQIPLQSPLQVYLQIPLRKTLQIYLRILWQT